MTVYFFNLYIVITFTLPDRQTLISCPQADFEGAEMSTLKCDSKSYIICQRNRKTCQRNRNVTNFEALFALSSPHLHLHFIKHPFAYKGVLFCIKFMKSLRPKYISFQSIKRLVSQISELFCICQKYKKIQKIIKEFFFRCAFQLFQFK